MKLSSSSVMLSLLLLLTGVFTAAAQQKPSERSWSWSVSPDSFSVTFRIDKGFDVYSQATRVLLSPPADPISVPKDAKKFDPLINGEAGIYYGGASYTWKYAARDLKFPLTLTVEWQACSRPSGDLPGVCFMPERKTLAVFPSAEALRKNEPAVPGDSSEADDEPASGTFVLLPEYTVQRSAAGYLSPSGMLEFLRDDPASAHVFRFEGQGFWMTVLLALLGGLALNLTPCVLPLIPVNLAVIGADARSSNGQRERIVRGLLYGAGIALTYGVLGAVAVLTGGTFGAIASLWWFQWIVAAIFLILGLAMFDVIHIDFSGAAGSRRLPSGTHLGGVFLLGAVTALLAGACVAPVLAAALIQASVLVSDGNYAGLLLPLLLGVGMALPWPFAAAGLSFFPKPGAWMNHVKHILGVLILLLAVYYAYLGFSMLGNARAPEGSIAAENAYRQIDNALKQSKVSGKPALLDFWATWCKNCTAMEHRTFRDSEVKKTLDDFILVRVQAEDPTGNPETAKLLKEFGVTGLPSFVILTPNPEE